MLIKLFFLGFETYKKQFSEVNTPNNLFLKIYELNVEGVKFGEAKTSQNAYW
jgi:hypothetical protein